MKDPNGMVVVTGASGGIGRELAKLFARDGYPPGSLRNPNGPRSQWVIDPGPA